MLNSPSSLASCSSLPRVCWVPAESRNEWRGERALGKVWPLGLPGGGDLKLGLRAAAGSGFRGSCFSLVLKGTERGEPWQLFFPRMVIPKGENEKLVSPLPFRQKLIRLFPLWCQDPGDPIGVPFSQTLVP